MNDGRFFSFIHKSNAKLKKLMRLSPHKAERMAAYAVLTKRKGRP